MSSARNSAAGPDGFSVSIIKQIFHCISYPILVIFQQSLHRGMFPTVWKAAYIAPIYKNKGDKCDPSSYRPVSLCSCFEKILEHLVTEQLIAHLTKHFPLHNAQHGFIMGRSTVTNSAACDSLITDCVSLGHPYDIITSTSKRLLTKYRIAASLKHCLAKGLLDQHYSLVCIIFVKQNLVGAHWRQNIRECLCRFRISSRICPWARFTLNRN